HPLRPFPIPYAAFLASACDGRSGTAPTLPPRRRPLSTRALGRIIHQHVPLLANAAHLAGVLQHPRCLHRLATHCESSQPQSMQECALLARIGRTTHTTTVYGVHGACFSSPTRRRPAPRYGVHGARFLVAHAPPFRPRHPRPFRAKYPHRRSTPVPAALISSTTSRIRGSCGSRSPSPAPPSSSPRAQRASPAYYSPSALEHTLSTTHSATGVRATYGGHFPSRTSYPSALRASSALYHAVARISACRTPQTQGAPPATCTTAAAANAHPPRRVLHHRPQLPPR
ncbi:hypothetical protein B0H14DRAFT_3023568, partial [Mycena olivaceomarginata]